MKRYYETELEAFRSHLILMGEKAIEQVRHAIEALEAADSDAARKVIAADDALDHLEMLVDDEAVRYMNLRAPIATDLRLMVVGMKVSHELERVGDEAQSIAKRTLRILAPAAPPHANASGTDGTPESEDSGTTAPAPDTAPTARILDSLLRMAALSEAMLRDALDCFFEPDNKKKALSVLQRDDEVDAFNRALYREISEIMNATPSTIPRALELVFISKSLERIADHATNIAEEMVYLVEAHDIRHHTHPPTPAPVPTPSDAE